MTAAAAAPPVHAVSTLGPGCTLWRLDAVSLEGHTDATEVTPRHPATPARR